MNKQFKSKLTALRREIDKIDRKIIQSLTGRMKVSRKIGALKKKHNVSIVQKARWSEVVADRLKHGKKLGLNLRLIDKIFKEIQKESIAVQKKQRKMK